MRRHVSSIDDIKPTIYGGNTSNIIQLFPNFESIVYLFRKLCTGSEDSFVYLLGNLSVISIYDVHYDILLKYFFLQKYQDSIAPIHHL